MKRIELDDDIVRFLASRAVELGESASSILRRELNLEPSPNSFEVEDDVYQALVRRAVTLG